MANFRIKSLILSFVLALSSFLIYFAYDWLQFLSKPVLPQNQSFVYSVKPGNSLRRVTNDLHRFGIIKQPRYFVLFGFVNGVSKRLKAGEYLIEGGSKPPQILTQMVKGNVIQHQLSIIEGWTVYDIVKALQINPNIHNTLDYTHAETLLQQLNIDSRLAEGLFYPDTYHFPRGTSDKKFLLRAYRLMQQHLKQAWQNRQTGLPYKSAYQALIAASMIEKETAINEEKPLIASVIINRLNRNMPLQIDPTVIYGLGPNFKGKLSKQDLRRDTQYNTYRHRGLPPTPIALSSPTSIEAALHPAKTRHLYFVAKGDGRHHFSETLKQQNNSVRRFILNNNKNKKGSA